MFKQKPSSSSAFNFWSELAALYILKESTLTVRKNDVGLLFLLQ
jgi:hypothetical protein